MVFRMYIRTIYLQNDYYKYNPQGEHHHQHTPHRVLPCRVGGLPICGVLPCPRGHHPLVAVVTWHRQRLWYMAVVVIRLWW
jgi:hypothetical protein